MVAKNNSKRALTFLVGGALILPLGAGGQSAPASAQGATGTVQAISAKDKQEGAKAHPQLLAEFGGAVTGPQALYVESVGKKIAVQSGLSNATGDFTVTLLNSSIDNAFAIPGGYIYTTRQLVSLMNNEAELAGVLGHEVGHVAARHSAKRQSAATRNQIIGVLGAVLSGALLGGNSQVGQLLQQGFLQGSQILTLKFSRSQENEADKLGIEYLRRAGYDPRAMSTVLASLAAQNSLSTRLLGAPESRVPEWASTHPDPAARVSTTLRLAGSTGGVTNRDTFLTRINGLTYGDDPKEGVVEGRKFIHPVDKFAFEAPSGFFLVNGTQAVAISGQSGKGQLTAAAFTGDLDAYVRAVFAKLATDNKVAITPGAVQRTTVNGIPAAYSVARVAQGSSSVDVTVFAYAMGTSNAVHFMTIAQAGQAAVFEPMYASMRRISAAEAAAIRPRKLVVVTAKKGDTVQSLAAKMAYTDAPLDRFLVLNGIKSDARIVVGQRIKLVIY